MNESNNPNKDTNNLNYSFDFAGKVDETPVQQSVENVEPTQVEPTQNLGQQLNVMQATSMPVEDTASVQNSINTTPPVETPQSTVQPVAQSVEPASTQTVADQNPQVVNNAEIQVPMQNVEQTTEEKNQNQEEQNKKGTLHFIIILFVIIVIFIIAIPFIKKLIG